MHTKKLVVFRIISKLFVGKDQPGIIVSSNQVSMHRALLSHYTYPWEVCSMFFCKVFTTTLWQIYTQVYGPTARLE